VSVVDPHAATILSSTTLSASPDYVRYVSATNERWITEPAAAQIEVIALSSDVPPRLSSAAAIRVDNGPESLVVDQAAGRAYTHRCQSTSVVINVRSRSVIAEWPNGCAASRGLAVDGEHKFFFAGCHKRTLSILDTAHNGRILSSIARGSCFDVPGYSSKLGHVYLAGTACHCLVVVAVNSTGGLSFLVRFNTTSSAHCGGDPRATPRMLRGRRFPVGHRATQQRIQALVVPGEQLVEGPRRVVL
jgi:DNA-binding beta-propeller fold protein YncE